MTSEGFTSQFSGLTLFQAFAGAAKQYGTKEPVLEDAVGTRFSYSRMLIGARILGKRFCKVTRKGEIVPVLLPNANAVVSTFLGLQSAGRIPAMLNYTAGPSVVVSACQTVEAKTVIASRQFIEKAELEPLQKALKPQG